MRRRATVVATAFAATALYFHRAVFTADLFVARDIFRVYYPLKAYWAQRVSSGEFPSWFPADGLGQPYVGMVISGAFHPLNALYLVFPLGVALKLNMLACFPAAILGTYALARRLGSGAEAALLAGIAYGLCGFLTGLTNNLLYLEAAATVPWVLWATDRLVAAPSPARVAGAGALLALVGFAGDGQTFAVAAGLVVFVAALRGGTVRAMALGAAAVAVAGALCAVQILPAMATLPESGISRMDSRLTLAWSMHPLLLLDVLLGAVFGGDPAAATSIAIARDLLDSQQSSLWVESMHLGLVVVILAGAGAVALWRQRRFQIAAAATLALTVLLLGKHAGLYQWMTDWVPFWRAFRYPMKLAPLLLLPLSLCAAAGLDAIDRAPGFRRGAQLALGAAAGLCAGASLASDAIVRPLWATATRGPMLDRLVQNTQAALGQTAFAAVAALLALTFVRHLRLRRAAIATVVGVHLFVANEPLYLLADPAVLETPPPFAALIRQHEPQRPEAVRVTDVLEVLPIPEIAGHPWADRLAAATARSMAADSQLLWGFDTSNAYLPATSARYRTLVLDKRLWLPRYSALFATPYIVIPAPTFEGIGGTRESIFGEDPQFQLLLLKNDRARPRAYLARPRCVENRDAAVQALAQRPLAAGEAIVECSTAAAAPPEPADPGVAAITAYAPERVEVAVEANGPVVLVLNDAHYRGWSATVDGRPVEIRPANVAVRSVEVAAGRHAVVFSYRAPNVALGAWVSGLTALLAIAASAAAAQRKSRREKTTTASVKNAAV